MSVIAVKKNKDKITIGCDTQTSYYTGYKVLSSTRGEGNFTKIIQQNDMTIGIVGRAREHTLVKVFSRNHCPVEASEDAIIDFVLEFIDWCKKKDNTYQFDAHFLIIYQGRIFIMWDSLDIEEVNDYFAIGCGMFVAMGVLYTGGTVKSSLEAACNLVEGCSEPLKLYEIPL